MAPIETRQLHVPGDPFAKGQLRLALELLTASDASGIPPETMPSLHPETVELRMAIFRVTEIAYPSKIDRMSFFIRAILMDDDGTEHKEETDTHFYAFANEAIVFFFNMF